MDQPYQVEGGQKGSGGHSRRRRRHNTDGKAEAWGCRGELQWVGAGAEMSRRRISPPPHFPTAPKTPLRVLCRPE